MIPRSPPQPPRGRDTNNGRPTRATETGRSPLLPPSGPANDNDLPQHRSQHSNTSSNAAMMPNKRTQPSASPASSSLGESILQYDAEIDSSSFTSRQQQQQQQQWESESDFREHDSNRNLIQYASMQTAAAAVAPSITRSSPIAIVRSPGTEREQEDLDVDDDDDDDDNDCGVIDVEGDAEKLRRKYGEKNIVRTYHPGYVPPRASATAYASSIPNAPYLGSLSRSANQVLSMPPMSLASGQDAYYHSDPPESISNYGSLRDSHERGRFLDGPSSYREPTSGRIRQLDHRLRYLGRRQPELSIGERMERSMQLRSKKQGPEVASAEDTDGKQPATSSLSAMMDRISKSSDTAPSRAESQDFPTNQLGQETLIPVGTTVFDRTLLQEQQEDQMMLNEPPSMMLSTSLTAFEVLKTSNTNRSRMASTYSLNQSSPMIAVVNPRNVSTTSNQSNVQAQSFQPLARSMSDPTPRFSLLSLGGSTRPSNPPNSTTSIIPPVLPPAPQEGQDHPLQQQPLSLMPSGQAPIFSGSLTSVPGGPIPPSGYEYSSQSSVQQGRVHQTEHDPDMEGAFGDMDME